MAVLNKMREKSAVIFGGLAGAFLLMIVFEWGAQGDFFRKSGPKGDQIGEVNGYKISSSEFESAVQQARPQKMEELKKKTLTEDEEHQLREQVWNDLIMQKLVDEKVDQYGITVTDQEVRDILFYSPNQVLTPDQYKSFLDSATGQFNQARYWEILRDPKMDTAVTELSSRIREGLKRPKLMTFVQSLGLITNGELWDRYYNETTKATVQIVTIRPSGTPAQFEAQVTDAEIKKYYDDHQYQFKREAAKKIKFVIFREQPSPKDSAMMVDRLEALKKRLATIPLTEPDSVVGEILADYTDEPYQGAKPFEPNQLRLYSNGNDLLKANIGDVVVLHGSGQQGAPQLAVAKVYGVLDTGATLYHTRHILIGMGKPENKDSARALATKMYDELKAGGDFAQYAQKYSTDGSARNGGDLGWSPTGSWVKPFGDAVNGAPLHIVMAPVETQFGFHIIEVLDKTQRKPIVAMATIPLKASSQTTRMLAQQAVVFKDQAGKKGFDQAAKDMNQRVITEAPPISKKGQPLFGSMAFNNYMLELATGDISEPMKVPQMHATVVAQVVEDIAKGVVPMDDKIKDYVKKQLGRKKFVASASARAKELRGMVGNGESLDKLGAIDSNFRPRALSFGPAESAPGLGTEYAVNNAAFSMKPGQISDPIVGDYAVYLIQLVAIAPADKQMFEGQRLAMMQKLGQEKNRRFVETWFNKLKDDAKVIDYRSKMR